MIAQKVGSVIMTLGKCPYCENGEVEYEKKKVLGKNTKVYTCQNARWKSEDEGEACIYTVCGRVAASVFGLSS